MPVRVTNYEPEVKIKLGNDAATKPKPYAVRSSIRISCTENTFCATGIYNLTIFNSVNRGMRFVSCSRPLIITLLLYLYTSISGSGQTPYLLADTSAVHRVDAQTGIFIDSTRT